MKFLKKLFGLDTNEPMISQPTPESLHYNMENVYPIVTNYRTTKYKLANEMVRLLYDRENIYGKLVSIYTVMNPENIDSNGDIFAQQIVTENMNEDEVDNLRAHSQDNFDKLDLPFSFWNETGQELNFKIISCPVSPASTSKVISKKHMLEAHKMLNTEELLVSIPLSGLILACDRNISDDDMSTFMSIHSYILLDESNHTDVLCEDILLIENGEISGSYEFNNISKQLFL